MSADVLRDLAYAKAVFQLRAIEAIFSAPASADTRPEGGDSTEIEAPSLTSGAVDAEGSETPR